MSTPVDSLLANFVKASERLPQITIEQARNYEDEIIDLNTDQLFSGLDANTKAITPSYRPLTITIKRQKGQPTNRVTLKDTGDFYAGFEVRFDKDYFAIFSIDDKAEKIERKYSKDIFGLDQDAMFEVAEYIKPDLQNAFRKQIFE